MKGPAGEDDAFAVKVALAVGTSVALSFAALVSVATAGSPACGSGASGGPGYAYAGHQAAGGGHGVRARISLLEHASVPAGHVAGWVGVGGPKSGPNGEDQWLQVGIAVVPQTAPMLYAEITRAGRPSQFVPLETDLQPGVTRSVAVLEIRKQPGWWRVWVGDKPVTRAIRLLGSNSLPQIATAESWNGGRAGCNSFRYRFDGVDVAAAPGGSWRTFRPGYKFLDRGYRLRQLTPANGNRLLSGVPPQPYAFEASSP
jgi:hypothetical protein